MKKLIGVSLIFCFLFLASFLNAAAKPNIQIALLLDTSNSMDGLIEQAKSQLWKVVNEFALAKYEGETPNPEIALFEYGNDRLKQESGYIRLVAPLTTDLDLLSEELFSLTTNGGSEYCGWVIQSATDSLKWSKRHDDLKIIFIAGNEPFTQGTVDFRQVCKAAITRGIIINTIFCGDYHEGVTTNWKEGAELADGKYMNIDQNQQVAHIDAPQDEELNRLNAELNKTYIPYGESGAQFKERQAAQDMNARTYGAGNVAQRAISKASSGYRNVAWDLVDALKYGEIDIEEIDKKHLPEQLQNLSDQELKEYVEAKRTHRQEIQEKIKKLSMDRRRYVAKKQAENSETSTLDAAVIEAVHQQAKRKNFTFE